MKIHIITLFEEMFATLTHGVTGRAIERGLLDLTYANPRAFSADKHRTVDDRPYGGGPGMVMMAEPLSRAIASAKQAIAHSNEGDTPRVALLSPAGRPVKQADINQLATRDAWIVVCGRYEGVDQRLIDSKIDEQWCIGDYVLSGGELPAMVMIDAIARQIPGVLGNPDSLAAESFSQDLLDCPHYTRPEKFANQAVPEVLLRGHHAQIALWREQQALGLTWRQRPELLNCANYEQGLTKTQKRLLAQYIETQVEATADQFGDDK